MPGFLVLLVPPAKALRYLAHHREHLNGVKTSIVWPWDFQKAAFEIHKNIYPLLRGLFWNFGLRYWPFQGEGKNPLRVSPKTNFPDGFSVTIGF